MSHYVTVHLHNVTPGREADYAAWFDGPQRQALAGLRGFEAADRYELAEAQVMPDIAQPWRFVSVYECDYDAPEAQLAELAGLIGEARAAGMVDDAGENERVLTYAMYSNWKSSANHQQDKPLSGLSVLLGNYTPGREAEYHDWYDNIHCPEVTASPGKVAMKRGKLAAAQIEPRRFTYGGELVLCAQQTDDLAFTVGDFSARARGVSPSGVAYEPRSTSGSFARTVHYFTKVSGDRFWDGGVAYVGDMSAYPGKS